MQNNSPKNSPLKGEDFFKLVCGHVVEQGGEALLSFNQQDQKIQAHLQHNRAGQGIDELCSYLIGATQEVLSHSTSADIQYAKTLQEVSNVHLKPDVGCFVQFNGDYHGLLIMNFSTGAALEIFKSYMKSMKKYANAAIKEEVVI